MRKHSAVSLLFWLLPLFPVAAARAAVTEIRKDFLNQTSLLSASPIMAAPTGDGSYLICVTAGDVQSSVPTAILRWTDENGLSQDFTYPSINGVPNGCALIRNAAGTAATIETDGSYSGSYNLFAFGFGFWPGGSEAQEGLKEPITYAVTGANNGFEFGFPGYPWLFAIITSPNCAWQLAAGSAGGLSGSGSQISTSYGAGNGMLTTLTSGCSYDMFVLQFGTPAVGAGPVGDREETLLDWTDATYPRSETVFTAGASGAYILLASNIAEQPDNGIVGEGLITSWSGQSSVPCGAAPVGEPSGTPASCVAAAFIPAGSALQFLTYNTPGQEWGSSPTYSAEVDVIRF